MTPSYPSLHPHKSPTPPTHLSPSLPLPQKTKKTSTPLPLMAAGITLTLTPKPFHHPRTPFPTPKPHILSTPFNPLFTRRKNFILTIRFVAETPRNHGIPQEEGVNETVESTSSRVTERLARKKSERFTYLVAALMSSLGITSMAVLAVYYRFSWQMEGGDIPVTEMLGTFALSVGAAVGMEFWARWAHKALWHASLWHMHESHHKPREGPFELNDVFAIINAVPAIALLSFGFFHKGLVPGLCFGAGLGITVFGMAYMFVHDGLVHRRFPVGPIADVPYLRKVAAAHQLHHTDKFQGVPYGLFLGPMELDEVGGSEELEKEINRRIKRTNGS